MFYDRKIKYFDYMEHGERLRNGGFAKLEARDAICNLTIHISGLHNISNKPYQVYLISGEHREKLCEIQLQQGKGSKMLQLNCDNICAGISYQQIEALQIPLSQTMELRCNIEKQNVCVVSDDKEEAGRSAEVHCEESRQEVKCQEEELSQEKCQIKVHQEEQKEVHQEERREEAQQKETQQKETQQEKVQKEARQVPLLEDKWKQLSVIYPHITPFRDEREYLSIGPGDFVILPRQYYKLANNSFLLHGFYNYRHLILACVEKRGEMRFYVGVPGNFYEREKQVALMFGFESFECREEPAGVGDFGYYMMRVEI